MLKERQKTAKSGLENDVNNLAKSIDHSLFKSGNFTDHTYNKYIYSLNICPYKNLRIELAVADFNSFRVVEGVNNSLVQK